MTEPLGEEVINIEYYPGAYGPTVRIDIRQIHTMAAFREMLDDLASMSQTLYRLTQGGTVGRAQIVMTNVAALDLVAQEQPESFKVFRREKTGERPSFKWKRDPLGWTEVAEKVETLIAEGEPAHQYLTREGTDDALVELSLMGG